MAREFSPEELGITPVREFSPQELGVSSFDKPKERTFGEATTDIGAGLTSGLGSLVQLPSQVYGLATGDFSDTGLMALGKGIQKTGEGWKSEALKQKEQNRSAKIAEAEKEGLISEFTTAFGETIKDPALLTSFLAEQAPQMIGPGLIGKGVKGAVLAREIAKGVAEKEAASTAAKFGLGSAVGTNALVQGADIGAGTYEETYNEMIRRGISPQIAKDEALSLARMSGASGAVISLLSQRLPGAKTLEKSLVGIPGTSGRLVGAGKGFLGEAVSEGVEEGGGKFGQNVALSQVAPETDLLKGVGTAAGLAAIGGGTFGTVGGVLQTPEGKAKETIQTEETKTEIKAPPAQLLLPSPEEIVINQREYDPLKNPLGNFNADELTPEQIKYIDADRKDNGKPRLASYSLEDLVDAVNHSSDTPEAKQGAIDTLLTFKSGYTGEEVLTPQDIFNMAEMKNIETQTVGFNDFLRRTTGTDALDTMSEPQLYSAFNALSRLPVSPELQILPEGTNAVRFSEKQYEKAMQGLEGVFDEFGTNALSRTSVIQEIQDFAGLEKPADAEALYKQALRNNDLEENLRQVKTTEGIKTVPEVSLAGKTTALPSGFDIKEQEFKQGVMPESYEIRNGSVLIDTAKTEADANQILEKQTKINQDLVKQPLQKLAQLEKAIEGRNRAVDVQKAKGFADTLGFQKMAAHVDALNKIDRQSMVVHQNDIKNFTNPLKIVPFGEKPITAKKQVFYEDGKPLASFGDKYQAEQYGIMKLDDAILQQIIDTAPTTKGILPKRYAAFAAKEIERRAGKAPKGIEVKRSIYADKVNKDFEKLQKSLLPALERFGLKDVALRIVNSIADGKADGSYVKELIKIAYNAENPMGTLRHEAIHALKELGAFTAQEWKVLSNKAKSDWIDTYIKKPNLYKSYQDAYKAENGNLDGFDAYIIEEAIAEAFSDFANTKPPAGLIGNIFYRLNKMFEALGNTFKRLGYTRADDIFAKVERGEAKPTRQAVSEGEKFAKKEGDAPEGIPQKLWDLQKKMRDAESSARDWNYGASKRNLTMASRRLLQAAKKEYGSFEAAQPVLIRMNEESSKREEKLQRKPEEIRKIGENLVGAPPDAKTVKDRTALVKRMTNLLEHPFSMYKKSKDWYERSGDTIAEIAHGDKALMEKIVRLTSLYSQANSLGGNITAVIKSMKQLADGSDTAYAGRFPETTAKVIPQILAAKNFDTDLAGVNDKLMNFYHNLHDGTFKTDTFADASTIDRWMMRLFGYPHSEDQVEGGANSVSATQYKYAKDLVSRIADANEKRTGERLLPRQIQAVLWAYIKNTTEYNNAKKKGKGAEFKPSSLDFSDYVNRATANITWESRPSTQIDLLKGIHTAPRKDQDAFNRAVRSIFETDSGDNKIFKLLNEGVLYSSQNSIGAYENQIAPNVITRLVLNKDKKGHMTEVADKTAAIIGYVTKQDAVPWYRADPTATGAKGYKVTVNVTPDEAFENKLFKHLNEAVPGIGFTRVDNSFDFINFRDDNKKPFLMSDAKYIQSLQNALETFSSDVVFEVVPFRVESSYIFNDWKENPNGEGYLERFGSRELTDIQPTIDGWSKDYDSIAKQFGKEYGWEKFSFRKYTPEGLAEPDIRPSGGINEGIVLGVKQENASTFEGIHYGKVKTDVLSGSKYSTGIKGAEAKRLANSDDQRIKNRVYFYIAKEDTGKFPSPEAGLGTNVYTQTFDNILAPGTEMSRLNKEANGDANTYESSIVDAGYDGYAIPNMGMMVILNHDVPVQPIGTQAEMRVKGEKFQIKPPETKEFKQWFGNSKIVDDAGNPLVVYHGTKKDFTEFKTSYKDGLFFFSTNPKFASNWPVGTGGLREGPVGTESEYKNIKSLEEKLRDKYMRDDYDFKTDTGSAEFDSDRAKVKAALKKETGYSSAVEFEMNAGIQVMPVYLSIQKPFDPRIDYKKVEQFLIKSGNEELVQKNYHKSGNWVVYENSPMIQELKRLGYDGIWIAENVDGPHETIAAFNQNQIKSAFNQKPTESADIRYQIRAPETKEFEDWFEGSKVVNEDGSPKLVFTGTSKDTIFNAFRISKNGVWFSEDPKSASTYAVENDSMGYKDEGYSRGWERKLTPTNTASRVIPAFLRIKNPFKMTQEIFDEYLQTGEGQSYKRAQGNYFERLRAQGYDGVDMGDGVWVVILSPDQIKSAFNEKPISSKNKFQIRPQEEFDVPETGRKDNLIFLLQDKQIDLKRIIDGLKAQGKEIADKWNAYLQEELFHGRSATRVKFYIDRELQPLLRQMDESNITLNEMDDYLLARHAKEANEYIRSVNKDPSANAGMTDAEAEAYIKAIPPMRRRVFDRLATEVDKMTKETRQLMVDYGLETQETINAWEKTYKTYVPLFREETEGSPISAGRGFNIRGSTTRTRTGSSKKVVDVLANVALQRERTIARGEKNRVGNSLLGLILQNPNSDYWIAVNPDDVSQADLRSELIAMGLNPDVAENLSNKPKERKLNPETGLYEYKTNPMWMQQPNVFMTRVNGQDRIMVFNENNERAARMAVIFNNLDQNQKGQAIAMMGTAGQYFQDAINVIGKGTRYFAAINTQYNPAFSIYNFMRDVGGATLNLQSTALKGKEYEVISNAFIALKSVYQDLRLERAGKNANSKWAEIFEEFELEGGKTGFRDLFNDSETRARALETELNSFTQGAARQKAKAVFDWLSDFNEAVENSIRVSAYKSAKDMGMSPAQAASLAKNLTVNFNRTGAMSKSFTTIYAFFNASIQGSARIAQTLMNSDGTLSSAGKMIIKGGITVGVMQAILMAIAGFEDDEPPDFVKDKNFVIPYGDKKYIAIPMPLGFNIIPSFGRRVAEFVMSNDKNVGKTVFNMGNMILDGFNPLGSATFAQTLSPTLTDPIIALAENKDFSGKPISRDDINSLNPTPGYTRAKDNASALSTGLAYAVNLLSGGTEFKKGVISPTPDQLDYLIGQITGGVGREVLKVEKAVGATISGEDLATFNIPIVGRMIGDVKQKTVETSRFYDNIKSMNEHQQEIDGRLKDGEDIEAYLDKYPEAGLYKYADKVYNKITKLKQERKKLKESGATDNDLKGYDEAILAVMMGFNEAVIESK